MWICPLRLRAAQKDAKSKTAFARMLLMFFYKKEELKGRRLHELDQDIVHAVAGWYILQTSISGLSLRAGGPGFSPRILRYITDYCDIKPATSLQQLNARLCVCMYIPAYFKN